MLSGTDTISGSIRPEFLCCYLLVISISLHVSEAEIAASLGFTLATAQELAMKLFSAAQVRGSPAYRVIFATHLTPNSQALLWTSDFLSEPLSSHG